MTFGASQLYVCIMEKKNNTHWTDTKGIAEHFNLKPGTLRKQRAKKMMGHNLPSKQIEDFYMEMVLLV